MRIALLTSGYPSDANRYNWTFVHARAKGYAAAGHDVHAFVLGPSGTWSFEGIDVSQAPGAALVAAIRAWRPEVVALHGPYFRLIRVARVLDCGRVVWVHGHEVLWSLGGFRVGRDRRDRLGRALKTPLRLVWQSLQVRRFLHRSPRVVFVSDWMRRAAERHTAARYGHAVVIPNPIDMGLFRYQWRADRLPHGVTIRSLNSRKYGVDLAVRAMTVARGADLDVIGTGSLEPGLRRLASRLGAPVRFRPTSIPHAELPSVHGTYGFFVAASRVEAQGVAMCEAMASGLPVIATRVGGIPEFVTHGVSGLLADPGDWRGIGAAVSELVADPAVARRISEGARQAVAETCDAAVIVPRELALLRAAASEPRRP